MGRESGLRGKVFPSRGKRRLSRGNSSLSVKKRESGRGKREISGKLVFERMRRLGVPSEEVLCLGQEEGVDTRHQIVRPARKGEMGLRKGKKRIAASREIAVGGG